MKVIKEFSFVFLFITLISFLPSYIAGTDAWRDHLRSIIAPQQVKTVIEFGKEVPIVQSIVEPAVQTMIVLACAFGVALTTTLVFAFLWLKAPQRIQRGISSLLAMLEAVPDVFLIVLMQLIVIQVYQQTGVLVAEVLAYQDERVILVPTLCLSIVPTLQMFRYFVSHLQDEQKKSYYEMLKAKGLSETYIIIVHLYRNALVHLGNHARTIFVALVSSLVVIEGLLNVSGIFRSLLIYGVQDSRVLLWGLIVIYVIYWIYMQFIQRVVSYMTGIKMEVA